MKRQTYIFLGIGFLLLGLTGCTTESNHDMITPTITIEKQETPLPTLAGIFQQKEDLVGTDTTSKQITKTEGLCEVVEKTELSVAAYQANMFNRMLSQGSEAYFFGESLFCVEETTGVIYFVNQAQDNYLYRMKEGEVQLAVAMPVKELYPYDGSIYFMVDSYDIYELQGMKSGDIYCYSPASGAVELVYPAGTVEESENHRLWVEESGIYFYSEVKIGEKKGRGYCYYLPFGEVEPVKDPTSRIIKGWDNYSFSVQPNFVLSSRSAKADGTREIIELSVNPNCFCVVGDLLYSTTSTSIVCTNLRTGEETIYDFTEAIEQLEEKNGGKLKEDIRYIKSFTITEEALWVTDSSYLYRMDLKSGEITYAFIADDEKYYYRITTLYTDGKEIYGFDDLEYSTRPKEKIRVVRLLIKQMGEIEQEINELGDPIIGVEFLVK